MPFIKNSPARYELLTKGPLATYKNPMASAVFCHHSNFSGVMNDAGEAELIWSTATEINNDYFTVQRSQNGKDFESIAKVKGAGNCYVTKKYGYTDAQPYSGTSYYRLKQTDYDQTFTYSKVITVNLNRESQFKLYPNPTLSNTIFISISGRVSEDLLVYLYDASGRVINQQTLANQGSDQYFLATLKLPEDLLPGVYYLRTLSGHNTYNSKLLILSK